MATQKQIDANRRNAQKSTGPRTEEGKRVSALNAYTHGLTAQTILLTAEQAEARWRFVDSIVEDLKPVGAMEKTLARSIADTRFRINRVVAIEDNIFAYEAWHEEGRAIQKAAEDGTDCEFDSIDEALAQVRSFIMDPKRFDLLTIYEARLERKAQQELKQLRQLQTERRAEEEKARQAAVQPTPEKAKAASAAPQPAESEAAQSTESTALEPEIGFDFSDAEIGHERPAEIPVVAYAAQPVGSQQHVAQS